MRKEKLMQAVEWRDWEKREYEWMRKRGKREVIKVDDACVAITSKTKKESDGKGNKC